MGWRVAMLALGAGFLAGAARADMPLGNYAGADAGWIVFSTTTSIGGYGGTVTVRIHRDGDRANHWIAPFPLIGYPRRPDTTAPSFDPPTLTIASRVGLAIDGPTGTWVYAFREPPGQYDIYEFEVDGGSYVAKVVQDFKAEQIPFTVTTGATTYVGSFTFVPVRQVRSFWNRLMTGAATYGWAPIRGDRSDRDMPIARARMPDLGPVTAPPVPATGLGSGPAGGPSKEAGAPSS